MAFTRYTVTADLAAAVAWISDRKTYRARAIPDATGGDLAGAIMMQQFGYLHHTTTTFYRGETSMVVPGDVLEYNDADSVNCIRFVIPGTTHTGTKAL